MDDIVQVRRHNEQPRDPTLPVYPHITPRPFILETEPRRFQGSGTAADPEPLTIRSGSDVDLIQIVPGTINTQYPTIGGTSINAGLPPEITISAATTYVWIKCVATFGSPDSYTLTIETTTTTTPPASPAISATGFTTCFLIGHVTFASGAITGINNTSSGGNMGVESFGSVNLWWKT